MGKNSYSNYFLALFFWMLCLDALHFNAQTTNSISYNSYLSAVISSNPLYYKAENMEAYGEIQLKAARGNYDPVVKTNYASKQFKSSNYYSIVNAEVKQPLFTSQYIKAGYELATGMNVNPETYTPPQGIPFLGLEVGVLQGLFIDKRRAEVLKAKEYYHYYEADRNIQVNELMYHASQAYMDWLYRKELLRINSDFILLAEQRLNGIKQLSGEGERSFADTIEAAMLYHGRFIEYQNVLIEDQKQVNTLSFYMQGPNNERAPKYIPLDSLESYYTKCRKRFIDITANEKNLNPMVSKYTSAQKILSVETRYRKEMIKPVLNISYNFLGTSGTSGSEPMLSSNNYKLGLHFSFPLLFRTTYNEYKLAKINQDNAQYDLANKKTEIDTKLTILKQTTATLISQVEKAQLNAHLSRMLLDAELLKFDNGESSLFMLNTRESKWLETEIKLAELKWKFIKNVLATIYMEGSLNYEL